MSMVIHSIFEYAFVQILPIKLTHSLSQYQDEEEGICSVKPFKYKYIFAIILIISYPTRTMQEDQTILYTRLKCSIIKDLFSQIMKNTKSANTFYLKLTRLGIRMVFLEKDKELQIFVCLSKQMFQLYSYNREEPFISKYDIKDLDLIGVIFQNQTSVLQMSFSEESMKVWHTSEFLGQLVYRIQAHQIDDIPTEVREDQMMPNQQDEHTKVELVKMKSLSNILHTFSLQKTENIELRFKSVLNQIQIVPMPQMISSNTKVENPCQIFTLNVKYIKTQMLDHLRFNVKKFKTCLGLFDKNNRIMISFFNNCAKLEVVDKEKKNVEIILACLADV